MSRHAAYHVGRRGEVAGGMTQVVNGYLEHTFRDFDTRVIVSRDGGGGPRAALLAARALRSILRLRDRERIVVVVHLSQGGSFVREGALLLAARARGFATVAQLHGSSFAAFARKAPRLVGPVLRAADLVLTLSEETSAVARRFVDAEAVVQLPNAVPAGRPHAKERLVVFGGAVTRRKGVDVLVEAWRRATATGAADGWRLVVAGPVLEPDVVPAELPGAEFPGSLDHAELMGLLDGAAVAVLPSRDEAMPMFILEALARSACVVSTDVGGVAAVLADGAGAVVEPGSVAQLHDALERVLGDAEFREGTARRGRAVFDETYSADAVFPEVERAWRTALRLRAERRSRA